MDINFPESYHLLSVPSTTQERKITSDLQIIAVQRINLDD